MGASSDAAALPRAGGAAAYAGASSPGPVSDEALRKLTLLSAGGIPDAAVLSRLRQMAALPCVEALLALPDLHQKEKAEVPSSLAVTTVGAIVPEFTSVAVNDGMGVVLTDLETRDLTPERILALFTRINAHAAEHVLDANRYSLSARDLAEAALRGAPAGVERYGLDPEVLDGLEGGGCTEVPEADGLWEERVPPLLRATSVGRCEMGLNFGGNHFLELQAVDEIADPAFAAQWGLRPGRVALMYHLGPGPFGSILLHHFSRRRSLRGWRAPVYFLSKLLFHYASRGSRGSALRKWALHFRRNGWTVFPSDSEEGLVLRQALAMATNFGSVYRLATVAAIRDALQAVFSPRLEPELLCDISHNGVSEEPWRDGTAWVARHNACRAAPDAPAIVAGAHDVPSYLGRGLVNGNAQRFHSYDHGAGHLIDVWRRGGRLAETGSTTIRLRMNRGRRGGVLEREVLPVRSSAPVDHLIACLERHGVVGPAVRLRPLATLKN